MLVYNLHSQLLARAVDKGGLLLGFRTVDQGSKDASGFPPTFFFPSTTDYGRKEGREENSFTTLTTSVLIRD